MQCAADDAAIVGALLASNAGRQKRFNVLPLLIRQPKQARPDEASRIGEIGNIDSAGTFEKSTALLGFDLAR
jgi:hypothetical protein